MRSILALVDHSVYAKSVYAYASWLAANSGAAIELLHVVSPQDIAAERVSASAALATAAGPAIITEVSRVTIEEIDAEREKGEVLLGALRDDLIANGTAGVTARLVVGDLADAVREAEDRADVIVVGKRGEDADFSNLKLGHNFERVAWGVSTPVLIAPRIFRAVGDWLLAFDGSDSIVAGANKMMANALLPNLPCQIVHVGQPDEAVQRNLMDTVDTLSEAGFPVTLDVIDGDPERIIPERVISSSAGLVALGGYKRSRIWRALFGQSTASALIRACQTPVLLMR